MLHSCMFLQNRGHSGSNVRYICNVRSPRIKDRAPAPHLRRIRASRGSKHAMETSVTKGGQSSMRKGSVANEEQP